MILEEKMATVKHRGAVKRFGARYGKKIRERLSKIESLAKSRYKCPYCNYVAVVRESVGIYNCRKCGAKFTGKAYSPVRVRSVKKVSSETRNFDGELFQKKEKVIEDDEKLAIEAREQLKKLEMGDEEEGDELDLSDVDLSEDDEETEDGSSDMSDAEDMTDTEEAESDDDKPEDEVKNG